MIKLGQLFSLVLQVLFHSLVKVFVQVVQRVAIVQALKLMIFMNAFLEHTVLVINLAAPRVRRVMSVPPRLKQLKTPARLDLSVLEDNRHAPYARQVLLARLLQLLL